MEASYAAIVQQISKAKKNCKYNYSADVQLIAVSKHQPESKIMELYQTTECRHFGENYIQELARKAASLPKDINWHFLGHLQSNKVKQLLQIDNLKSFHGLDSKKVADLLQDGLSGDRTLEVFVEVNMSGEKTKSGLKKGEVMEVCRYIWTYCPRLILSGLMCVPSTDNARAQLVGLRIAMNHIREVMEYDCERPEVSAFLQKLSMGMSDHIDEAVEEGSTHVRVGTAIFGARPPTS
eukprot:GHVH01001843.1.p1 GENE.GHVH01001843.1~~GHVH01001843.1.p1  ORF type:complete len:245 (+),score=34.85 GHVH01001843.1:26-736(+)